MIIFDQIECMAELLNGKVALVTGGGRDIGRSISKKLASLGAYVIINYFHTPEAAVKTCEEIRSAGGSADTYKADLTITSEVKRLVDFCTKEGASNVDILINNAGGILGRKKLIEQDETFYSAVMDLNFKSMFLVTRALSDKINRGGSIINISSQAARDGGGGGSSLYAASKGAITTYTRSLAKELGPEGIRVNAVCPGLIGTLFHDLFTSPENRKKAVDNTPLRREGHPDDVANLVAFLASDEASFITGANYDINGGFYLS